VLASREVKATLGITAASVKTGEPHSGQKIPILAK
jgi:hypothetical protein